MESARNSWTPVNMEPLLPESNEELIRMLGLDRLADNNTESIGSPSRTIGFDSFLGHQQLVGNSERAQTNEMISYIDFENPYQANDTSLNALTDNNEVIQMLYQDEIDNQNNRKLIDNSISNSDYELFTMPTREVSATSIGFDGIQDQHHHLGNSMGAYQTSEIIAYLDMSAPEIENNQFHMF